MNEQVFPKVKMHAFGQTAEPIGGLTKREYIAAHAMQGLLSDPSTTTLSTGNGHDEFVRAIARVSVRYADELLEALNAVD